MSDTMSPPAPGWYPDPAGTGRARYWDGSTWGQLADAPAPVKRSHTTRNVLLVLVALLVVGVGACTALVAAAGSSASKAVDEFNKSLEPQVAELTDRSSIDAGESAEPTTTTADATSSTTEATPTTATTPVLGSQKNPGAVGQTFTLKDRDHGDFDVTITGFEPDAWPAIAASNSFNSAAADGKRYVAIDMTVVYHAGVQPTSGQSPLFNLGVSLFGSVGQERNTYDCSVVLDGELDMFADLIDGGTASGRMCFVVDEAEAAGPILVKASEDWCLTNCDEVWIKVQ